MTWEILISSLAFSLIILVPLSIKWGIPRRIGVPASFLIGISAGLMAWGIREIYNIKIYQVFILQFLLIIGISGSLLVWRFFRDPERIAPEDRDAILSPADGKVIYVKRIEKGIIPCSEKKGRKFFLTDFIQSDVLPTEGYLIGICMTYLDVHVNRAPIDGKVFSISHIKGGFASLRNEDAVIHNARALTVIDNGHFKIGVVQIASRLVRKIVLYLREGQEIRKGERMGMIRFGSQVDLILPGLSSLNIEINSGEDVKAGVSIMARIMGNQERRLESAAKHP
jgi:phosphatidylserine decarboxylase